MHDVVIIGAGPAGLYTAMRLEAELDKNVDILILEKDNYLGGRTRQERFHSRLVATGAGVGRFPKDRILARLTRMATQKPIRPISTRICYQMDRPARTMDFLQVLRANRSWIERNRSSLTFRDCFLHFFSPGEYTIFCDSNGYTDFEEADAIDTLDDYGFEDNIPGAKIFYVPWNQMIRTMRASLQSTVIHRRTTVGGIVRGPDGCWAVKTDDGRRFRAKNVVFAGSIERFPYPVVQKGIGYNRFLRMYAYLASSDPLHKGTTYTSNRFQKIISLSPRIQMLSYSDTRNADAVNRMTVNQIEALSGNRLLDVRKYYRRRGTHYYKPLDKNRFADRAAFVAYAQNPEPHIFLVGEVISRNQGWTEGAFESVEKILPDLLYSIRSKQISGKE